MVGSDYVGPHLPESGVTIDFVKEMTEHFKQQKNLHKKFSFIFWSLLLTS